MIEVAAVMLICGTFIGMVFGVFLMCLMAVASDADEAARRKPERTGLAKWDFGTMRGTLDDRQEEQDE